MRKINSLRLKAVICTLINIHFFKTDRNEMSKIVKDSKHMNLEKAQHKKPQTSNQHKSSKAARVKQRH